jgi:hypothetical protein
MQPLQSILANLKVTKKTRLEDLSNEAGRVISHLPDLSWNAIDFFLSRWGA